MVRMQSSTKKFHSKAARTREKAAPLMTLPGEGYAQAAADIPEYLPQVRYLQGFAGFPVYTGSTAKYLSPGEVKFQHLLEELEKAEQYIFLEYFIVQEGVMWDAILEILKRKVRQGVKVRLMYDDLGCFFLLPKDYAEQMKKLGIECVVFNPFRPFLTVVQNNRDHRKIVSIDGKVAFTGGINLADEYINAVEKHGHWKDASIMVTGRAAWSFTLMFLQMWEVCTGLDEDYTLYYPWKDAPCPVRSDGFVQPYADSPMDKENVGEHVYMQIINNAKKCVYINTPYLIIDDSMVSALRLAAKSGREVLTRLSLMVLWLIISRSFLLLVLSDRICSCFYGILLFKLAVIKGGVSAFFCQQLLMAALLDDIAVLHKQDDVRVPDGGEAVGDHKAGPPLHQLFHGLANLHFGAGIHAGSGLVQDNDGRVAEEHPGDGEKLALSGGKVCRLVVQHSVIALRHGADKVVHLGRFGSRDDFLPGGVRLAVGDIFSHCAGKQPGVLEHHAEVFPESAAGHFGGVYAVYGDFSAVYLIEPHQKVHQRGFACAGAAHHGDFLAGFCRKADVLHQNLIRPVSEAYMLKGDIALGLLQNSGNLGVGDLLLVVQQFKGPFGRSQGGLEGVYHKGCLG